MNTWGKIQFNIQVILRVTWIIYCPPDVSKQNGENFNLHLTLTFYFGFLFLFPFRHLDSLLTVPVVLFRYTEPPHPTAGKRSYFTGYSFVLLLFSSFYSRGSLQFVFRSIPAHNGAFPLPKPLFPFGTRGGPDVLKHREFSIWTRIGIADRGASRGLWWAPTWVCAWRGHVRLMVSEWIDVGPDGRGREERRTSERVDVKADSRQFESSESDTRHRARRGVLVAGKAFVKLVQRIGNCAVAAVRKHGAVMEFETN